jgi:energy-converting hydrogenase Eha subunit A
MLLLLTMMLPLLPLILLRMRMMMPLLPLILLRMRMMLLLLLPKLPRKWPMRKSSLTSLFSPTAGGP